MEVVLDNREYIKALKSDFEENKKSQLWNDVLSMLHELSVLNTNYYNFLLNPNSSFDLVGFKYKTYGDGSGISFFVSFLKFCDMVENSKSFSELVDKLKTVKEDWINGIAERIKNINDFQEFKKAIKALASFYKAVLFLYQLTEEDKDFMYESVSLFIHKKGEKIYIPKVLLSINYDNFLSLLLYHFNSQEERSSLIKAVGNELIFTYTPQKKVMKPFLSLDTIPEKGVIPLTVLSEKDISKMLENFVSPYYIYTPYENDIKQTLFVLSREKCKVFKNFVLKYLFDKHLERVMSLGIDTLLELGVPKELILEKGKNCYKYNEEYIKFALKSGESDITVHFYFLFNNEDIYKHYERLRFVHYYDYDTGDLTKIKSPDGKAAYIYVASKESLNLQAMAKSFKEIVKQTEGASEEYNKLLMQVVHKLIRHNAGSIFLYKTRKKAFFDLLSRFKTVDIDPDVVESCFLFMDTKEKQEILSKLTIDSIQKLLNSNLSESDKKLALMHLQEKVNTNKTRKKKIVF